MSGEGGKGSGGTSAGSLTGETYVDGTEVKYGRLIQAVVATLFLGAGGLLVSGIETIAEFNSGLIRGFGDFAVEFVTSWIGEGAGLVVAGWRGALLEAMQFGPFTPIVLALEAIVVLLIIAAIWRVNPYL